MYVVTFRVPHDFGEIGAFFIRNNHRNEFYLLSLTLENPDKSTIEFPCNSWVYNTSYYKNDRVFFSNKVNKLLIFQGQIYLKIDSSPLNWVLFA